MPAFGVASVSLNLTLADLQSGVVQSVPGLWHHNQNRHVSAAVSAEVLFKHRADSGCDALGDTGGAVLALGQSLGLGVTALHATQMPQNHRGRKMRQ
ncbi:RING finger protein 32 [Lates japonicus]|uniref:RING finger protein 32 n=1 Tax=Lates japonicus TaxID=270547 RepID=A0AAD3MJM4_LATJO|nr:RING finger protein 32 [Lates japonicus]